MTLKKERWVSSELGNWSQEVGGHTVVTLIYLLLTTRKKEKRMFICKEDTSTHNLYTIFYRDYFEHILASDIVLNQEMFE